MKTERTNRAGTVYSAADVSRILGFSEKCSDPVPQAANGEIVIYYGGWDLKGLRSSTPGQQRMPQDGSYDRYAWHAEPGYYGLLLPVPESNRKRWSDQLQHLATIDPTWQPSPVCIAATALLVHLTETGNDLLRQYYCRCAEKTIVGGNHAALRVIDGLVCVGYYFDDLRRDYVSLSAARRVRTLKS